MTEPAAVQLLTFIRQCQRLFKTDAGLPLLYRCTHLFYNRQQRDENDNAWRNPRGTARWFCNAASLPLASSGGKRPWMSQYEKARAAPSYIPCARSFFSISGATSCVYLNHLGAFTFLSQLSTSILQQLRGRWCLESSGQLKNKYTTGCKRGDVTFWIAY